MIWRVRIMDHPANVHTFTIQHPTSDPAKMAAYVRETFPEIAHENASVTVETTIPATERTATR